MMMQDRDRGRDAAAITKILMIFAKTVIFVQAYSLNDPARTCYPGKTGGHFPVPLCSSTIVPGQ
jgi:hypothetical protein